MHEPLAVAGALAAARLGVPAVLHENSLFDGPELIRVTAARLGRAMARHEVAELPPAAATLTIAPPSVVGERAGWPLCGVPYSGEGALPEWLSQRPARPRIAVSRSTVAGPGDAVMSAVVAVTPAVDAEFVLVRPDRKVLRRTLPANVRTVDWIPLNAAMASCAGIVHHGGAGTVFGAFAAGIPQLVLTGAGDRTFNARLVARRGAGLALSARQITAEALTRLVTDPALAEAAVEVQRELAAMPAADELVPRLVALVD